MGSLRHSQCQIILFIFVNFQMLSQEIVYYVTRGEKQRFRTSAKADVAELQSPLLPSVSRTSFSIIS